ncbi:hypothetical protein IFM89_000983 [Coptis chinensis]|uniref:tRNA-guanine(15) transglycosylase-like domain-containing protein n=1 Tax=Coptis chinensis TaxID=261450 RepID=A0A835IKR3_9MAGN|nr:hypothetical protein IFM89_000983 [Coptis chinensis]
MEAIGVVGSVKCDTGRAQKENNKKKRMKFTVKALSNSSNGTGRARVGLLQLGNCPTPIETPSLLLSTRKALLVFIAPDLLPSLLSPDSHLLQVSPLHFLESPTPNAISSIRGLHKMVGLHKYCFVAAPRDSMLCLPACESSNKFGASFETPCSRRLIRPVEYMEMISSLKPNLWASLADEVLKLDQQMKDLAKLLMVEQSLLVFGRGYNYATVLEGALKVKEVALMHTEGILTGK